jgi:hypothetical protein
MPGCSMSSLSQRKVAGEAGSRALAFTFASDS